MMDAFDQAVVALRAFCNQALDDELKECVRAGYRGPLYVWYTFTLPDGVTINFSYTLPSPAPDRLLRYIIDDEIAAAVTAALGLDSA